MKKYVISATVALVLSGCGGSSGSGGSDNNTPLPQQQPSATGVIQDIGTNGTINVNGNQYQVDAVLFQEQKLDPSVLTKNMVVQVETSIDANEAQNTQVTLQPTMSGVVTEKQGTSFSVNGVALEFQYLDDDIEVGDWVFVSSLPTADAGYNVLSVVEIDVDSTYPNLANYHEIEGRISSIDPNAKTLLLSEQISVYYADAYKLPHGGLKVGQWVEIEGRYEAGQFIAQEIELDDYSADSGVYDDIEGIVTSVENIHTGTPSFTLNFRGSFATEASTCYRNDDGPCNSSLISKLKPGVEVEVYSRYTGGQRIATMVEFETPDWDNDSNDWSNTEFECEGIVSNHIVTETTNTFQISRCENDYDQAIPNNTVVIDAQTRFEDIHPDHWSNLNGLIVDVEGIIINNQNIAREIELEN